MFTVGFDVHS